MILDQSTFILNRDTVPTRLHSCHSTTVCFLESLGGKVSSCDKCVKLRVPPGAIPPSMWIMVNVSCSSDEDYPPVSDDQVRTAVVPMYVRYVNRIGKISF